MDADRAGLPEGRAVFLAGPTGVGKSAIALELADQIGGEIVCADAFQVYRQIPVLTAQPPAEYLKRIPHHLFGCIPIEEAYTAVRYAVDARRRIAEITERGMTPVIVGGAGLYIRALVEGLSDAPASRPELRSELDASDLAALADRLRRADPAALEQVDTRNKRRLIRAIEICELSGKPLADFRLRTPANAPGVLLLRDPRDLHQRIEANIKAAFAAGVVEEVARAGNAGETARKAIGFSLIESLLRGEIGRETCASRMLIATRQYAKRQLTWFRSQSTFIPLHLSITHAPSAAAHSVRSLLISSND